ncbi:hypothetical protein [Bacteroides xylanisolvens]|uniref:hypothetical protein n=2 Tax=Bacteroides TaxID=816 RepID=UPI0035154736
MPEKASSSLMVASLKEAVSPTSFIDHSSASVLPAISTSTDFLLSVQLSRIFSAAWSASCGRDFWPSPVHETEDISKADSSEGMIIVLRFIFLSNK